MPNWCYNDLTITGKPKMIDKLLKQVKTTHHEAGFPDENLFDFNKVIPMPPQKANGMFDWYNWSIENWGTKWNSSEVQIVGDWEQGEVHIYLETAWSPPEPVIRKLAEQNPSVTIVLKTHEEGMSFYATIQYKGKRVKVLDEGEFATDTPCEVYQEYMGDSTHHWCSECSTAIECEGNPQDFCVECNTALQEADDELWEEDKEQVNV